MRFTAVELYWFWKFRDLQKLALLLSDEGSATQLHKSYAFCDKGYIDYQPYTATIDLLSRAITEHMVLELEFKGLQPTELIHYLWAPQVISAMNGALYVFGSVLDADLHVKDQCFIAIHRITRLVEREEHFSLPPTELKYHDLVQPWNKVRTYVIRFAPGRAAEYVRERTWAHNETKRDLEDGGLELELITNNDADIHNWVQRFAPDAKLVSEQETEMHMSDFKPANPPLPIFSVLGGIATSGLGLFMFLMKRLNLFQKECKRYHGEL